MTGRVTMRFVGLEHEIAAAADWNRAGLPKLWLYNAHYFDDLVADGAAERAAWHRDLMTRWIAENPPGRGNGWEPYPTSLRIVNWVKFALAGNVHPPEVVHSLAVQTRWLSRRPENHLLGNHLWANAKALVFAGVFFEGREADAWREKGLALLRRELEEQILPDGGHFERSPMYHAILLEDALDLVQMATVYPAVFDAAVVARWRSTALGMLRWLRVMCHPDGEIAFFNDAALGIAPNLAALTRYTAALGVTAEVKPLAGLEWLRDTGYVRLQNGSAVLLADVGEIGPDYLPGHAHADTLSFELSLHGQRLFVNGGVSRYDAGAERLHQRGTAMHNAVQLGDHDSSEVWSSFRVARRARPRGLEWKIDDESVCLQGAHDGYRRLPRRPMVSREWQLWSQSLCIIDTVRPSCVRAVARFRLHPEAVATIGGALDGTIDTAGRRVRWQVEGAAGVRVAASSWHPRFGQSLPCQVLEFEMAGELMKTTFTWE
jgi:uncharacterized heparinase superfamily protein